MWFWKLPHTFGALSKRWKLPGWLLVVSAELDRHLDLSSANSVNSSSISSLILSNTGFSEDGRISGELVAAKALVLPAEGGGSEALLKRLSATT